MSVDKQRIVVLFGPTASGKTAAAIALAQKLNGEIVNADSRQVYRHMPLIAACPAPEEYAAAPHHLFEYLEPPTRLSAGGWAQTAMGVMADILARGKTPLVVGGTGFYLKALMGGLDAVPVVPEDVEAQFKGVPPADLHARLQAVDPALAAKLHPTDTQRLVRALAVEAHTGVPLSRWQERKAEKSPLPYAFVRLALSPPREVLHTRIAARWEMMKQQGVVEEAAALRARGCTPGMPGITGLGITELWEMLDGNLSPAAADEKIVAKTRQYAKRQVTWLRHQYPAVYVGENGATLADAVMGRFI